MQAYALLAVLGFGFDSNSTSRVNLSPASSLSVQTVSLSFLTFTNDGAPSSTSQFLPPAFIIIYIIYSFDYALNNLIGLLVI